jgi:hypothetical protein
VEDRCFFPLQFGELSEQIIPAGIQFGQLGFCFGQ